MGDAAAPSAWGRTMVLVGLAALAITHPVLDLMGRNPEFFVAGAYTRSQIVAFAVTVVLVPVVVLAGTYLLVRWVHRPSGAVLHAALVAALGAVIGNVVLRGLGHDGWALAILAGLGGAVLALLLARWRPGGLLLQYLAGAQILFLVAFLVMSPAGALLSRDPGLDALGEVSVPVPPGPVVVVVFDELPLPTLLTADGTINPERYPAFARLAESSTWFRNTSSPHNHTELAVPAIATGNVVEEGTLPTQLEHPRNLLALMSTVVPVHRLEPITDLCPRNACERRDGQPLTQALEDSAVVYGHRILPAALREDLPSIDETWGSFGGSVDARVDPADPLRRWHETSDADRAAASQNDLLIESGTAIDATPALHFLHVVTPHVPWDSTPWGSELLGPMPPWRDDPDNPDSRWSALVRYQRHSLQTGAADVALGEVLDHLEMNDLWDDTTLLVVADHGTGTVWPDVRREQTPTNADEVLRVPMFLKAAGQQHGEVVDDVAMTVDALPTLLDALDVEVDWDIDGHSLLDGSDATTSPLVGP
ncbi:MAG: sulfatase-like hydrolase/transferase, partial [Acidimicrobiales bacterium]